MRSPPFSSCIDYAKHAFYDFKLVAYQSSWLLFFLQFLWLDPGGWCSGPLHPGICLTGETSLAPPCYATLRTLPLPAIGGPDSTLCSPVLWPAPKPLNLHGALLSRYPWPVPGSAFSLPAPISPLQHSLAIPLVEGILRLTDLQALGNLNSDCALLHAFPACPSQNRTLPNRACQSYPTKQS